MSIELPKDAEGREIPLDTEVLYSEDGRIYKPVKWLFYPHRENAWTVRVEVSGSEITTFTELLFLTPPDSWEKLLEDLDRAVENNDAFLSMQCAYMNQAGDMCGHCKLHDPIARDCFDQMVEDIASRIRKLRSEDE